MTIENQTINVLKLNLQKEVTWQFAGKIRRKTKNQIVIEAYFDREDMTIQGKGDRFVETYYTDRWYNIFEIHARENGPLRGWYCNISYPARLLGSELSYVDLALDLIVFPNGQQIVVDENEFNSLPLSDDDRRQALDALVELKEHFSKKVGTDLSAER
jgi:protein associated with RNAse G/E